MRTVYLGVGRGRGSGFLFLERERNLGCMGCETHGERHRQAGRQADGRTDGLSVIGDEDRARSFGRERERPGKATPFIIVGKKAL